jgi:hypothetical protein
MLRYRTIRIRLLLILAVRSGGFRQAVRDARQTRIESISGEEKPDHLLEAALPGIYPPLYTMATFTRIQYAKAARHARLQDRIVYGGLIFLLVVLLAGLLFRLIAR